MPMIETHALTKIYNGFHAVENVSLKINKGEIYGFIGLNGAGKTTTIRMLLGMIKPTYGACYIKGENVGHTNHQIWRDVGYLVETPHSYPELSVEENLDIFRRLRLISERNIVATVMEQLNLGRYAKTKAKDLSLGNAQRLGIAKAILHRPKISILDEPMNGLDPAGIVEIREMLQNLALKQGVTVLISSHLLSEVAKIATKIGIIHEGQLIQEIEANNLKQLLRQRLIVDTRHNESAHSVLLAAGYRSTRNKDGSIQTYDEKAVQHPEAISQLLVNHGIPPNKLIVEEDHLESYFLRAIDKGGEQ